MPNLEINHRDGDPGARQPAGGRALAGCAQAPGATTRAHLRRPDALLGPSAYTTPTPAYALPAPRYATPAYSTAYANPTPGYAYPVPAYTTRRFAMPPRRLPTLPRPRPRPMPLGPRYADPGDYNAYTQSLFGG